MSSDPIGDMLAMLWNANHKFHERVDMPFSGIKQDVARVLKEEGYILNYSKTKEGNVEKFDIHLKYHYSNPVVNEISVVSKPGRRIYRHADKIPLVKNGLGMVL